MSSLEKRAWLTLWTMLPPYVVYFAIQAAVPALLATLLDRFAVLAAAAAVHAIGYIVGVTVIGRRERAEPLHEDERDRAIDGRATRAAYFMLLAGMIVVGMVMPFTRSGWDVVNAALLVIVLSESMRHVLIVVGYRRPRLAY
jgi:hypothetical protein